MTTVEYFLSSALPEHALCGELLSKAEKSLFPSSAVNTTCSRLSAIRSGVRAHMLSIAV